MTEWQPIETAPRDGTRILSFSPESNDVGQYDQQNGLQTCYFDDDVNIYHSGKYFKCAWVIFWQGYAPEPVFCIPTHWMPLPKPPETEE